MRGRRRFRNLTARGLHQVITEVHSPAGEDGTVQAVTDAVVSAAGFGIAVVSVARPGGTMETVAVAGSDEARAELLGLHKPRQAYEDEFAVADHWGSLLFVPHERLPNADQRGWVPRVPARHRRRAWHPLDALYAPLHAPTGEFVGALSVDLPVNGTRPGRRQRELLEILAVQAGIAIDNARMAEQLRAGEKMFRWAFQGAGTGMALLSLAPDSYGRYLLVNPTFCRIAGRTEEEISNLTALDVTHSDDRADSEEHFRRLLAGEAHTQQREKRLITGAGGVVWVSVNMAHISSPDGSLQYAIAQVEDITDSRARQQDLLHRASHDPLTGLANRTAMTDRLRQAIDVATGTGRPGAVLFVDLDGFKDVNDEHGHPTGDQALVVIADRLAAAIAPGDMAGRIGGDEFLVVADDMDDAAAAELAARLAHAVAALIVVPGATISITVSIGHASIPPRPGDPDTLIAAADRAMYSNKHGKLVDHNVGAPSTDRKL
jgi:diguanylate cyclase (GGDEF)-like protein/PAS domain S-box-containing protein